MTTDQIFSALGQLVAAGGGGALVAFAIFRYLGKSWIEHELAKDLESAKSELGLLAARRMKLHDREYVVFPEVWDKLNKASESLGRSVSSMTFSPDFARMSEPEIANWVAESDLSDDEKKYFAREHDKGRAHSRIIEWRRLVESRKAFEAFHDCFQSNRIFIRPAIKEKLVRIDDLINESWIAKKMDWEGYSRGGDTNWLLKAYDTYRKEIQPLMSEIEGLVQTQLFPEDR